MIFIEYQLFISQCILFLRSRYENAIPNFCWVSCAFNGQDFLRLHLCRHTFASLWGASMRCASLWRSNSRGHSWWFVPVFVKRSSSFSWLSSFVSSVCWSLVLRWQQFFSPGNWYLFCDTCSWNILYLLQVCLSFFSQASIDKLLNLIAF